MVQKPRTELYGGGSERSVGLWDALLEVIEKAEIPMRDILENPGLYVRRQNLTRLIAHYELFRMVKDLPGSIVECGVYQGNSLFAFAKFLEIFSPGDRIRRVIGFDSFEGLQHFEDEDGPFYPSRSKIVGGWSARDFEPVFEEILNLTTEDQFVPSSPRIEMVKGDILSTVPKYVESNPGLRISLLHLDVDVFAPNLVALEHLYPRVVAGGVVILDEYAMMEWGGESSAVEAFFQGDVPVFRKFPWTSTPGGFFVKGESK